MKGARPAALRAGALTMFVLLSVAVGIRAHWLVSTDRSVADTVNDWVAPHHAVATAWTVLTNAGSPLVFRVLALLAGAALWWSRRVRDALVVLIAVAGATALSTVLKPLVDRPRPHVAHPVVALPTSDSYPSGHALTSMAALGAALVLLRPVLRASGRAAVTVVGALLIALIGVSRLVLGVHYLSDVLAGWLLGGVWLSLVVRVFRVRAPVLHPPEEHLGSRQ